MALTFHKEERLKSKRLINELFESGKSVTAHPVRLLWKEADLPEGVRMQFAVSVPKRNFKKAVDRNRIKRQMREAIRLNKARLLECGGIIDRPMALMLLYTGRDIPAYDLIERKITEVFDRLIKS